MPNLEKLRFAVIFHRLTLKYLKRNKKIRYNKNMSYLEKYRKRVIKYIEKRTFIWKKYTMYLKQCYQLYVAGINNAERKKIFLVI